MLHTSGEDIYVYSCILGYCRNESLLGVTCRGAAEVPQDRDLLLTFSEVCKPSYGAYIGGEDGHSGTDEDESTMSSSGRSDAADLTHCRGETMIDFIEVHSRAALIDHHLIAVADIPYCQPLCAGLLCRPCPPPVC